jgi:MFS family permease
VRTVTTDGQQDSRSSFAAFSVPSFASVWLSGLIWHLCRWGVAFLGTYLVNDLTGSPRLVQLTGTTLYAPLLVGGLIGGMVSDRFDRLRTVRVQLMLLIPLTIAMALMVRSGHVAVWMIYGYMFIVGIGWITDMTSRRALVFDVVGPGRLDNAMALESLSLSSGMVIGALVGGAAVEAVGIGSAYFFIAGFLTLSLLILAPVERPRAEGLERRSAGSSNSASPIRDLVDGVRQLRSSRGVMSILGVTAIANFFLFAYFPIVPVVAEKLDASAFQTGLLLAGTGVGMMTGSLIVARLAPYRRGLVYVSGVFGAMAFILPFALATTYWLVFAAIVASGVGSGFFGSTQSALVITEAPEELRGRALGLLSMAIGALPLGMAALGEVAERLGVTAALTLNTTIGAAVLAFWIWRRPEVRRMTAR